MQNQLPMKMNNLDDQQRDAVLTEGDSVVLSVPGSGKTTVIVAKVDHILDCGIDPSEILLLTFSKKTEVELRKRITRQCGQRSATVRIHTFHSYGNEIIRRYGDLLAPGLHRSNVISEYEIYAKLSSIYRQHIQPIPFNNRPESPSGKVLAKFVDECQNMLIEPWDDPEKPALLKQFNVDPFNEMQLRQYLLMFKTFKSWDAEKYSKRFISFGDMIVFAVRLLRDYPHLKEEIQGEQKHILIDEYQDTNPAQQTLVDLLHGNDVQLTVVGDEDQCIFDFRQAHATMLHELAGRQDFTVLAIETNYRSKDEILFHANELIKHNRERLDKQLFGAQGSGGRVECTVHPDELHESHYVAQQIRELHEQGIPYDEMAVLFRTNAQIADPEHVFIEYKIPYHTPKDLKTFYDMPDVKDALAYLELVSNPYNDAAYERIYNKPYRGLGKRFLDMVRAEADILNGPLLKASKSTHYGSGQYAIKMRDAADELYDLIMDLHAIKDSALTRDLFNTLITRVELFNPITLSSEEAFNKERTVSKLTELTGRYPRLNAFLAFIKNIKQQQPQSPEGKVTLSTIHRAKGMEYDAVFVMGFQRGYLPHVRNAKSESERRLAYVAMTRAKKHLYLTQNKSTLFKADDIQQMPNYVEESRLEVEPIQVDICETCQDRLKQLISGCEYCIKVVAYGSKADPSAMRHKLET